MEVLTLMTTVSKPNRYSIKTIRGYEFGEENLVVHRNVTDGLLWRITDITTGSNFNFISPSKKQAITDFYEGGYLQKYLDFKKTPKYKYLVEMFEKAKVEYLEQERKDEEDVSEMDVQNSSEDSR